MLQLLSLKAAMFWESMGGAVGWCYAYRHLSHYEEKLRRGYESPEDFRRIVFGMRTFAFCVIVCLAFETIAKR